MRGETQGEVDYLLTARGRQKSYHSLEWCYDRHAPTLTIRLTVAMS